MRYQERIYVRNDNRAVRNKDILNVSTSSDFGIFKAPMFGVSGATKVPCGKILCDLNDVPLDDIFTSATTQCLTATTTEVNTLLSANWSSKIYEDNLLTYSATFYTTTLSGDLPTNTTFINSITSGLTQLGYNYTEENNKLLIEKSNTGTKLLEFDICIKFDINTFTCPVGYSATPANDLCQQINLTAATFNGSGDTVNSGDTNSDYSVYGTYFYPNIQNGYNLPVYYTGDASDLKDQSNTTITPLNINSGLGNTFWDNISATLTNGRLNNVGLSASSSEWLGFSKCVDIETAGTYYVGLAADNDARFKIDGILYVNLSGSVFDNFKKWSVFPFYLESGLHIIEMEGKNTGSVSSFGAEIYNPFTYSGLTAATSSVETGVIFSTLEYRGTGKRWDLGENFEYSCPAGYALNTCSSAYTCTQIFNTPITASTGNCLNACYISCGGNYPYIDNTTSGTYIIDPLTTGITLTFNFTANTTSFLINDISFKYEIFKYSKNNNAFIFPSVYQSESLPYSSITSGFTLTQSIPVSGLQLDGQYLIKGYFEANTSTRFLKELNRKIDTSLYKTGGEYQLYDSNLDYYFIAMTEAESPSFTNSLPASEGARLDTFTTQMSLNQQVIIVENETDDFDGGVFGPNYGRTGSTFSLDTSYVGDIVVTLNGLVLSRDIDYTITSVFIEEFFAESILTLLGPVLNGDIITIISANVAEPKVISETILLDTAIQSGTTNNQGSNTYYYNTTTQKYEIFLQNEPVDDTTIIIMLNGIVLTNNIDYYKSITNNKRIILIGSLVLNDVITVVYYPKAVVINGIIQKNNTIAWSIENIPSENNGQFTLEYDNNTNFSNYSIATIVPYQENIGTYSTILSLTGSVGTNYYYRVKNEKTGTSICGDVITSTAYSETVKVKIQSNAINSY